MKFPRLLMALIALVALNNVAMAAFTFSLSPTAVTGVPGGPGAPINIIATSTTPNELFTVTSTTFNFTNNSPFITETANISGVQVATTGGNPVGTITSSILLGAPNGANDTFTLTINGTDGAANPFSLTTNSASITAVPEPTSLALVGLGGLGYAAYRKRRAAKA